MRSTTQLTCLLIIDIVGIVGNVLIMFGILSKKHLRNTTTNILMINLAATDLLLITTTQPFDILHNHFDLWPIDETSCKTFYYLSSVFIYTNAYTLVLMSVDRILAILCPDASKRMRTSRNTCIAILGLWVLVLFCCIPYIYFTRLLNISDRDAICIFLESYKDVISVFVTSLVLPMITFVILFVAIIVKPRPANEASDNCPQINISYLVVALDIVFLLCWGRLQAYMFYATIFPTNYILQTMFEISSTVAIIWSHARVCINPIIFFVMSKTFPETFKNVTYCHCLSRKSEEVKYSDMIPLSANVSDDDVN